MTKWAPSSKVTAATAGAAFVWLVIWALEEFYGYVLPADVAAAASTIVAFLCGFVKDENRPAPSSPKAEITLVTDQNGKVTPIRPVP